MLTATLHNVTRFSRQAVEVEKGDLAYADGMERMCKGHQSERSTALVFLDLDKSSEQELR